MMLRGRAFTFIGRPGGELRRVCWQGGLGDVSVGKRMPKEGHEYNQDKADMPDGTGFDNRKPLTILVLRLGHQVACQLPSVGCSRFIPAFRHMELSRKGKRKVAKPAPPLGSPFRILFRIGLTAGLCWPCQNGQL